MQTAILRVVVLLTVSGCVSGGAQAMQDASVVQQLKREGASAVMLEVASGRTLFQVGEVATDAAPGSVLKPMVLLTALRSGAVREHDTVLCRGTLVIAGHNLACSHPRDITVLDARQALANSCNTYFATVAQRMPEATLVSGLRGFGVTPLRVPRNADERALLALGLQDVVVSPMQLAEAYRQLAQQMNAAGGGTAVKAVRDGMLQSVETGMANAARTQGETLGGKTGTVDGASGRSHGWFAGIVFAGLGAAAAERVIVVYVPNGNGSDAAAMAKQVLTASRGSR